MFAFMKTFKRGNRLISRQLRFEHLKRGRLASHILLVDSSPRYNVLTTMKVHHMLPDSKLIFIMRDPVDRELSMFRFRNQFETRKIFADEFQNPQGFHTFVLNKLNNSRNPFSLSYYNVAVKAALNYFKRENLLFIKFEELISDPMHFYEHVVFPFLGIKKLDSTTKDKIRSKSQQGKFVNESHMKYKMLPKTRELLQEHFSHFNLKLAQLLHDDKWTWNY